MKFVPAALLLTIPFTGLVLSLDALAQSPQDVPIEQDLQREQRIERRIDRNRPSPTDPFVTPDNPDGVVGFDGPPGEFDEGVDQGGPMAPGSPADIGEN